MTVRRSAHGKSDYGIDPEVLHRLAGEIKELAACGAQVAIVIGGGLLLRGQGLAANTAWVLK